MGGPSGLFAALTRALCRKRVQDDGRVSASGIGWCVKSKNQAGHESLLLLDPGVGLLVGGLVAARFVQTLLFEVKATDGEMVVAPLLLLLSAGVLAVLPSAIRATRIDPAETLRGE